MEWYDPAAVTTKNGSLRITLSAKQTHGLDYQGGKFWFPTQRNLVYSFHCRAGDNLVSIVASSPPFITEIS
jgi:hypothetical protein